VYVRPSTAMRIGFGTATLLIVAWRKRKNLHYVEQKQISNARATSKNDNRNNFRMYRIDFLFDYTTSIFKTMSKDRLKLWILALLMLAIVYVIVNPVRAETSSRSRVTKLDHEVTL
jgi:hypothetical protein